MKYSLNRATKLTVTIAAVLYGTYLLKTLMGINISKQYSAVWILKAPLQPILDHKADLCKEFQSFCNVRTQIKQAVQRQINHAKHPNQA